MMNLRILLPTRVAVDEPAARIGAEGGGGSFTLLPRHLDMVAALDPGILHFENEDGETVYLAVDTGTLVKRGADVHVSTRRAVRGPELEDLQRTVAEEFEVLDDRERRARSAAAKVEAGFVRRFLELQSGRGR
ncbi:MAG: F0F1 ATP synthase subunit epsilon [Desulfococcaceae bacterium]